MYLTKFGMMLLACLALPAAAQSTSTSSESVLDQLDIIADELPVTGQVVESEFTGQHHRIERAALERRDVSLGDIIAFESGVERRQVGGHGSFSSITVRAASAAQTAIYLDGIRLNSAGASVIDLATLELLSLQHIDVYRGATPLQLGQGAIGGGINLSTLATGPTTTGADNRLLFGIGSFGVKRTEATHRSSYRAWDATGALSAQQADNDFAIFHNNTTDLNPQDDTWQNRNNAAVDRVGALGKLGYQWSDNSRTDLLLQTGARELGVPEWGNSADNQASLDTDTLQLQLGQTLDQWGAWNSRHTLFQHQQTDHYDDRLDQIGLGPQDSTTRARTLGFKTYWERPAASSTFGLTAEWRQETLNASDLLFGPGNFTAERLDYSVTTQWSWFDANERWTLTPALQITTNRDIYSGVQRNSANVQRDTAVNPRFGIRYQANKGTAWSANLGRYQRHPSFNELFGTRGLVSSNDDLVAEQGFNADIGLTYQRGKQLEISGALFLSERDELIVTVFDSRRQGRPLNIGAARILGLELSTDWQFHKQWSLRFNSTLQHAKNRSATPALDGRQIPGEPTFSTYLRLQHQQNRLRTWVESNSVIGRFYDTANLLAAEDQWLLNAGFNWPVAPGMLGVSINNVLNQSVEDFSGYPRPGRSLSLQLTIKL